MSNPEGQVNDSEKLLSSAGKKEPKSCWQRHKKCLGWCLVAQIVVWPCVFLAFHLASKSDDGGGGDKFELSAACLNADNAEYTVDRPSDSTTWVEDVQSNGKYWFAVVGNRNYTKSLEVYSADEKKLVKSVLMADNTTYLTTKDSKLTVSDDFAVLDLHAFPYQMPKKANVSYSLDISGDPKDWGVPTLEPGYDYIQSVARNNTHAYQLVREADGTFVLQSEDIPTKKSEAFILEVQAGTSVDNIGFTYLSGADRFVSAYADETQEGMYVIQSYDADFKEEAEGIVLNYRDPWTLEGVYPYDDTHAIVYLYDKVVDSHQFIKVDATNVTKFSFLPLSTQAGPNMTSPVSHNVSLQVSPIKFKDSVYFFLVPNGETKSDSFVRYPITVTKDFAKTYELDVGDISTRFVRMVGDRLLVAQSDTIKHTKMW